MSTDYYKILNVEKTATASELKKAYRKQAVKWHPDNNNTNIKKAEEEFKKISEAYNVLNNPEKRKIYDKYGLEGLNGGGCGGFDPSDMFKNVFSGMNGFNPFAGQNSKRRKQKIINIGVSLKELYFGCNKKINIKVTDNCVKCFKKAFIKCNKCNGTGRMVVKRQVGPMIQQFEYTCDKCVGVGKYSNKNINCGVCKNKRKTKRTLVLKYNVKVGSKDEDNVVFREKGNQDLNGDREDIVIVLRLENNTDFKIKGSHLIYVKTIPLSNALSGLKLNIEHVNGNKLHINEKSVIKPGSFHKIIGKGMPITNDVYGDLFIIYNIKFPEAISDECKKTIYKDFGQENINENNDGVECKFELGNDLSESDFQNNNSYNRDSDSDDDNNGNVQCAQQ